MKLASGTVRLEPGVLAVASGHPFTVAECETQLQQSLVGEIPIGSPPSYSACVTAARQQYKTEKPSAGQRKPAVPSTAELTGLCSKRARNLVQQALETLISNYWLRQTAATHHLAVTTAEVSAAVAKERAEFHSQKSYDAYLSREHLTAAGLASELRLQLLTEKVEQYELGPAPAATEADIAAYYRHHASSFNVPARHNIDLVVTRSRQQVEDAERAVKSGQSWATVSSKYSIDTATVKAGGVEDGVTKTGISALDSALASAHVGELIGPLEDHGEWLLVKVTATLRPSHLTLSQVAPRIKGQVEQQLQYEHGAKVGAVIQAHDRLLTACRPGHMITVCANDQSTR